jgi:hypothetical protein
MPARDAGSAKLDHYPRVVRFSSDKDPDYWAASSVGEVPAVGHERLGIDRPFVLRIEPIGELAARLRKHGVE